MIGLRDLGRFPAEVIPLLADVRFMYNGAIESGVVVGFDFGKCTPIIRPYNGGGDLNLEVEAVFRVIGGRGREYS